MPADEYLLKPLFDRLSARDHISDEEKRALAAAAGDVRLVPAKQDFVVQGSRPEHSTLILQGLAARHTQVLDGRRLISGLHLSGDFVDLHSLLLKTMDHGIAAMSPCTILNFPHDRLRRLSETHPHLTRMLWLATLIDAAIHRQWLVVKGALDSLGEAAHLLCELHVRHQIAGLVEDGGFSLPLTQQDFGDALGKSVVQTNRVIQTMRQLGLISWQAQRVTVLNWAGLAELAEFDPTYLSLHVEPR